MARNKLGRFLLAAGIMLAMTFTLSCSSDGDDESGSSGGGNGGVNPSELSNKQVYLVEWRKQDNDEIPVKTGIYNGNSNITAFFDRYRNTSCGDDDFGGAACECTGHDGVVFSCGKEDAYKKYDTLPAGNIQNGQVSLNLPDNVGKYLRKYEHPCDSIKEEYETCQSTFSVSQSLNISMTSFYVNNINNSGKNYCHLSLYLIKSGEASERAEFYYFSEAGKINGTHTRTYYDGIYNETFQSNYDVNYSKGWNIIYRYDINENKNDYNYSYSSNYTSDLSKTGGTLEWWIECNFDDADEISSSSTAGDIP